MRLLTPGSKLHLAWSDFVEALHAPAGQDFNSVYWLYRLSYALLDTIIPCRDDSRKKHINGLTTRLRPLIPSVGITLTLLCLSSYFTTFRDTAVIKKGKSETLHTSIVVWLGINILSHYFYCINKSPGIVISPKLEMAANKNASGAKRNDNVIKIGGCCFMQSLKINEEKKRSKFYNQHCTGNIRIEESTENTVIYHPMPNDTFCHKCEINRPARSHHCRVCKVCVLEYDHHCPWINGCIGYNNYRNFVLLIFYVMLGCWYGAYMLAFDFFDVMREYFALHGFNLMGPKYGTGLLDLPPPWTLLKDYRIKGRIDDDVVLRAVFPFLLFVSICMFVFLLDHLLSIACGYTTLEKKTRPDRNDAVNPFDFGIRKNFERVFGTSLINMFLPIPFQTTPRGRCDNYMQT
jgi:hypothetical protein